MQWWSAASLDTEKEHVALRTHVERGAEVGAAPFGWTTSAAEGVRPALLDVLCQPGVDTTVDIMRTLECAANVSLHITDFKTEVEVKYCYLIFTLV